MKNIETFKLTFDIMDITSILITFNNFGLKITNYYELSNTEVVEFEGTYNQLEKWYNEYYETGEDFKDYFDEFHFKIIRKELHSKTNKPRPQWWIDKITKAYEEAKKEGYSN